MAESSPHRYLVPPFCHSTSQKTASKPAVTGNCCDGIFCFHDNQSKLESKSKKAKPSLFSFFVPFSIPSLGLQSFYSLHPLPHKDEKCSHSLLAIRESPKAK
ncbi:hypothetical protein L2E82_42372 [Cichorium intybus]|uniref:Uncharacterized protein n=1 Tax=Cichorium intybus TaxID=13427 RepID=A0ACB8ZLU0_CICIN|nr:hypothetical protein L2E82_42372 [Cichorium intybus]